MIPKTPLALTEHIARMKRYGDECRPDAKDAMTVLNWLITRAREIREESAADSNPINVAFDALSDAIESDTDGEEELRRASLRLMDTLKTAGIITP